MSLNDWIKLNVGGRHFETTRLTLMACPDSLLAKMFSVDSSRPAAAVSADGAFKMDADPDIFGILLNWLRRKELMMTDGIRLECVAVEAEFFGLIDLKDAVEELRKKIKEDEEELQKKIKEDEEQKIKEKELEKLEKLRVIRVIMEGIRDIKVGIMEIKKEQQRF